jgi:hypothetical protein
MTVLEICRSRAVAMANLTNKTRSERVRAFATLIVWFCAGAFVASTLFSGTPLFLAGITDIVGGCVGAAICLRLS